MKKLLVNSLNYLMVILLSCSLLFGCTLDAVSSGIENQRNIKSRVATIIDEEIEFLMPYIEGDLPTVKARLEGLTGYDVVEKAMTEDSEKYINFCFEVDRSKSIEDVINATRGLVGEEELQELQNMATEIERRAIAEGEILARSMSMSQQRQFFKDLKKLVIKTTVLFAAGIVYAAIPKMVFWGKISAACAVSVAAGVVASGFMSFIEYKKFGAGSIDFNEWIEEITKEPYAAWAVAASMVATGTTMKRSPVLTGVIIAVFAIYDIGESVKPMLNKYNFGF